MCIHISLSIYISIYNIHITKSLDVFLREERRHLRFDKTPCYYFLFCSIPLGLARPGVRPAAAGKLEAADQLY